MLPAMSHRHTHVPEELSEGSGPSPGERILELSAVALLSLTVLATAWSGYQASLWSGEQSQHYAQSSATRIKAQQASTHAGQSRIDDLPYWRRLRIAVLVFATAMLFG
jgi:type VI protein secretion system component VasF